MADSKERFSYNINITITGVKKNKTTNDKGEPLEYYQAVARFEGRLMMLKSNKAFYEAFINHNIPAGFLSLSDNLKISGIDENEFES